MVTLPWQELQSARDLFRVQRFVQRSRNITWTQDMGEKNLKERFIKTFTISLGRKKEVRSQDRMLNVDFAFPLSSGVVRRPG